MIGNELGGSASIICFLIFILSSIYILIKVDLRNISLDNIYIVIFPVYLAIYLTLDKSLKAKIVASVNVTSIALWIVLSFF